MRTVSAVAIAVILVCGAVDARAEEFRETGSLQLGVAGARTVSPNDVDLGRRWTIGAAMRPWKLLELEIDLGVGEHGGTGSVRAGIAYPLRNPGARLQLDGVLVAGYRAMMGLHSSERADDGPPSLPGLPTTTLLHVAELKAALAATMWNSPGFGLTARLSAGLLVAPWASFVGYAPEIGVAAGVAF